MNTKRPPGHYAFEGRAAKLVAIAALITMGVLMVMSIVVSNDALGRAMIHVATASTDQPSRCGMSQHEFLQLPARLQMELTETCNRPPDVMP